MKIDKNKTYAVKSVEKKKLKGDITLLRNELEMLRFSDHPNIIQFCEIYQDQTHYHFVMEYCEGGDITTFLQKNGPFEEEIVRKIIFQVLLAINNLHSCGIVHRDIKPDNFLLKNNDINSPIKLIDFGLSKRFQLGGKMNTVVGTPLYVAPEVVDKTGYNEKCDLWSTGVMMYLLLVGDFPFRGQNNAELFDKVKRGEYSTTSSKQIMNMSQIGKKLLKSLLERNPNKRPSAREALRDPWFDSLNIEFNKKGLEVLTKPVLNRLRSFKKESKFSKEVIRLVVMTHSDYPEVVRLKEAFFHLDVLNNGVINWTELKRGFAESGEEVTDKETGEIIRSLELRSRNVITYTEFVTATIDSSFYTRDECLEEAFRRFDVDQDNFISPEDLHNCFCRFGMDLSKPEIQKMITEFDEDKDGRISVDEFNKIMKGNFHAAILNDTTSCSPDKRNDNIFHQKTKVISK